MSTQLEAQLRTVLEKSRELLLSPDLDQAVVSECLDLREFVIQNRHFLPKTSQVTADLDLLYEQGQALEMMFESVLELMRSELSLASDYHKALPLYRFPQLETSAGTCEHDA